MAHPLSNILIQLDRLTREQKLSWKASGRPAEFVLAVSGAVIAVSKNPFTELFSVSTPAGPFKLSLLSESGSELASLEARNGDPFYDQIKQLYNEVQQQATSVDERIGEIQQELARLPNR